MPGKASRKIACLFPGIGYTCDKPLLYYSRKLLQETGWEILPVAYSGFPSGVKGNPEKMLEAFNIALSQAKEQLKDIDYAAYDRIIFAGKSIGTAIAAEYDRQENVNAEHIVFTPVAQTFKYLRKECGIVIHGTSDPWCDTPFADEKCGELGIECIKIANANHSLETDSVQTDLGNLACIMKNVEDFINT